MAARQSTDSECIATPPESPPEVPDFIEKARAIVRDAIDRNPLLGEDGEKLAAAATYIGRDAEFSGYKVRFEHKWVLFFNIRRGELEIA